MLKRLLTCIMAIVFFSIAFTASAAEITGVRWSLYKDAKTGNSGTRVVVDVSAAVTVSSIFDNNQLRVSANNLVPGKYNGLLPMSNASIRKITTAQAGSATTVTLDLDSKIDKSVLNVFILKKDPTTNRPDRIVIDVLNQKGTPTAATTATKPTPAKTTTPPKTAVTKPPVTTNSKVNDIVSGSYKARALTSGIKGKIIVIDPGHGGSDPGAIGKNKYREKDANLAVAQKLAAQLRQKGATVHLTRTTDIDVQGADATDKQDLQFRVDVGTNAKADIFVSIHSNSSVNRDVVGTSVWYYQKNSMDALLASSIQKRIVESTNLSDLGTRQAGFYVVKNSKMPAVLVEMAFISNEREEKLLASNWFQNKMVYGIVAGIDDFFSAASKGGR